MLDARPRTILAFCLTGRTLRRIIWDAPPVGERSIGRKEYCHLTSVMSPQVSEFRKSCLLYFTMFNRQALVTRHSAGLALL